MFRHGQRGTLFVWATNVRVWALSENPDPPVRLGRKIRAWWLRKRNPGFGVCGRCRTPFNVEPYHTTVYDEAGGRGCFPLCEHCWQLLRPVDRVPYYARLVQEWIRQSPGHAAELIRRWPLIREAVLGGK